MTPIGVKTRELSHLYVLIVFEPGSRTRIFARLEARRTWHWATRGSVLHVNGAQWRIERVERDVKRRGGRERVVLRAYTALVEDVRRSVPPNVVRMPAPDDSMVTQFLRFHVLVRVFGGDPDAWLAHIAARGGDDADVRFARWIRARLRKEPLLLREIRRMVDQTSFWSEAAAGR